jgi:hypothetical protein
VCVWARQIRQLRLDDPSSSDLCVMCTGRFPRGGGGGGRYAPPGYAHSALNFFWWFLGSFLLFLGVF